jgi:hypothetical protein
MKLKYHFNFLFQLIYGIVGFVAALLVIYLITRELNWITSGIIGVSEFLIAGFYTQLKKA